MINAQRIREQHRECECFVQDRLDATGDEAHSIRHQNCRLSVRGFRLAIDCDKCRAFGPNDKRPDLFVLRERGGTCEWIVIEIQRTMDRAARSQIEAGLDALAEAAQFESSRDCKPRALFAHLRRARAQELGKLRKPLRSRGKAVGIDVKPCGQATVI